MNPLGFLSWSGVGDILDRIHVKLLNLGNLKLVLSVNTRVVPSGESSNSCDSRRVVGNAEGEVWAVVIPAGQFSQRVIQASRRGSIPNLKTVKNNHGEAADTLVDLIMVNM